LQVHVQGGQRRHARRLPDAGHGASTGIACLCASALSARMYARAMLYCH
jgi:hypothetical protein